MGWTRVQDGDFVYADHINDIQKALDGTAGKAQAMKFTQLEDLGDYALDVRNRDTVNGYVARFRNGSDELLLSLIKDTVTVGKQIVSQVPDGTAPIVLSSTTRVANLNADMVDGYNAGNSAYSVPVLDANADLPLAQIPDTLTGKDADSVDGAEPGNSEGDLLVLGSGALVPLANIPPTLTGKDADSVDGREPGSGAGNLPILGSGGVLPLAHIAATLTGKDADSVDGREPGSGAGNLPILDAEGLLPVAHLPEETVTRYLWFPPMGPVDNIRTGAQAGRALIPGEGGVSYQAWGSFSLPDYAGGAITVEALLAGGPGNIVAYLAYSLRYPASESLDGWYTATPSTVAISTTGTLLLERTIPAERVSADRLITVVLQRDGDNALDTLGDVYLYGFRVAYTAYK